MVVYKWDTGKNTTNGPHDPDAAGKLRVAAYCRVSTDDQESSFQVQQDHFHDLLRQHQHEWISAGIYADEGISGTGMRKRKEFLRMLRDCEAGRIDLIITKSISRFARNTVDMLITVRRLQELGVRILFEKEGVDTGEAANELFITFWASFAQAESVSISKNVVAALRVRMERGEGRITSWCSLGYRHDAARQLRIVPEEAVLVRRIYRMYLEGLSEQKIAERMMLDSIPAPKGGRRWYGSTIASMLTNEKYMGDFLFQKTFTKDTLTHSVRINDGRLPQYYSEGHHAPIVPKQVIFLVQGERTWRAVRRNSAERYYTGNDPVRGKLVCGLCGRSFKEVMFPDGRIEWRCKRRASEKRTSWKENEAYCENRRISAEEIEKIVVRAMKRLPDYERDLDRLLEAELPEEIRRAEEEIRRLVHAHKDRETYLRRTALYALKAEYERGRMHLEMLRRLIKCLKGEAEFVEDDGQACSDTDRFYRMTDEFRDSGSGELKSEPAYISRRFISRIIVFPDELEILFQGGLSVKV